MSERIGRGVTPAIPCALSLNRRPSQDYTAENIATLSHDECQKEFQHWIRYTRAASTATPLEISPKERLTCPLLWCRTSFKDLASMLNHVSSCPWLSDAWYWCPLCSRSERFTIAEATSTVTPHADDPSKEKTFNGAVTFFQTIGCRRYGRSRPTLITALSPSFEYYNKRRQLVDISYNQTSPAELDSGRTLGIGHDVQCVRPAPSTTKYDQYSPSTRGPDFWQDENHVVSQPCYPTGVAPERIAAGAHAQRRVSGRVMSMRNLGNEAHTTPIAHTQNSPVLYEEHAGGLLADPREFKFPKTYPPASQSTPHLLGKLSIGYMTSPSSSPGSSSPLTTYESEEYSPQQEPATAQIQISDLCEVVRALGEEWIRRLLTNTDITPPCSEAYTRALVEIGFRALRNYFKGTIPSTFQDVFALMHVAGASAYIIHRDNQMYSWDTFLSEAHQLQHLLIDEPEKVTFVKAIGRLCQPQGDATSSQSPSNHTSDTFLSTERVLLLSMFSSLPSSIVDAALQEQDQEVLDPLPESYRETSSYQRFRRSTVIKACTSFLDTLEYTILVEDSANRHADASWYCEQHVHNILTMEKKKDIITKRLQDYVGREEFGGEAVDMKVNVCGGLQRNVRELEVTLMSTARSFLKPGEPLARYLDVVNGLCDEAMQEMGENWRYGFYAIALNTALITSFQLNNRQRHLSANSQRGSRSRPFGDTHIRSPMGTTTSDMAPTYNHPASAAHTLLAPIVEPSADLSYCPHPSCGATFKGSYQRANLERHLRTTLHHNQGAQLKCEICLKHFTRMDNLQHHLRRIHKVDPLLKRRNTRSRQESGDIGG